jgi:hypothetical protein
MTENGRLGFFSASKGFNKDNKAIKMTVKTQQFYYNLLLQGYMFRLLRVIIRPSNEPTQDYLIPSAFWDPVALTICVVIVL